MKSIQVRDSSPDKDLVIADVAEPDCGNDQVLIEVYAAGVNRADIMQRAGKYPPPPGASPILGLEVAGIVRRVGDAVTGISPGERVCALLAGGGYAELVAVPHAQVMRLPPSISFEEGAGLPEAFITAFLNLFVEGGLQRGEIVLIHGGSSGVGTAAIQLARTSGVHVACTVGNEEKKKACEALGAEAVVNYKTEDFLSKLSARYPHGINLILDCVGGEYLERNVALLAPGGRLVMIASMGGAKGILDIPSLMKKRARIIGSVLRSRSDEEKGRITQLFQERFMQQIASRHIRVVVDSVVPFAKVELAHQKMQSSEHIGKIVLHVK